MGNIDQSERPQWPKMEQILLQEACQDLQDGARHVKLAQVVFNVAPWRPTEWQWRLPKVPRDSVTPFKSQVARRCLPSRPVTSSVPLRLPDGPKMTKRTPRGPEGPQNGTLDPKSTQRKLQDGAGSRFILSSSEGATPVTPRGISMRLRHVSEFAILGAARARPQLRFDEGPP